MLTTALVYFEKKRNSTLRPAIFKQDELFQGEIKGDFTPTALDMTFSFNDPTNVPKYNYAYIYPFRRFYFITEWLFVGGLWVASMTVDVLATYRKILRDTSAFCVRSASNYDEEIIDGNIAVKGGVNHRFVNTPASTFWGNSIISGSVVAGIVGSSGSNIGAVTYYAMSYTTFNTLMSRLLSSISWAGIDPDEISEELQKALINPAQYIVSCVWLPISLDQQYGTLTNTVKLGWWSFSLSSNAVILTNPSTLFRKQIFLTIPKHPEAQDKGKFLNLSPYSRYVFKFLPFGVFELDTTQFIDATTLVVSVSVNPMTGDAILDLSAGGSDSVLTSEANVGVQIPTGQIAANLGNLDQALLAGGIAGGADLIRAFTAAVDAPVGGTTVNAQGFSHKSGTF